MPRRLTQEQFIERASKIHNNKYDYSKVRYNNMYDEVIIICPEHGEFLQKPVKHLQGHRCPICGRISIGQKSRLTTEQFIEKAKKVHGEKYDYSKTSYTKNTQKVVVTCPIHGDFLITAAHHLSGHGCPNCVTSERYNMPYLKSDNRSKTRLYRIWSGIKIRTKNLNRHESKYYVEKGILMCDEWRNNWLSFYDWAMSNGYNDSLSIDRIDNNKGYEPDNCRWVTQQAQVNNRSVVKKYTIDGETHTRLEWCKIKNIGFTTVRYRMEKKGMTFEEALKTKKRKYGNNN